VVILPDEPRKYGTSPEEAQRLEAQAESHESLIKRELDIMGLGPNIRILDAGCGTGEVTRKLVQLVTPGEAVGIDMGALFIETAKKLA
jgi:ubiquinone/menaquinone biosynthesis C-methylase UbiE